jgi:hypothetical protein
MFLRAQLENKIPRKFGVSIDSEDNRSRMMGDRASVIFAAPEEITKMIEARC